MIFKLEICVDNVASAIEAQVAGAHRIELCGSLAEGGITPGYGTIISARDNLSIDLNVIIRPRGGDFLYTDLEYDTMRRDIEMCGEAGVNGIVLGILQAEGTIDIERTAKLVEFAYPMQVTFHRAFDMCSDPLNGLESVIETGVTRLLTSGHKASAKDGAELINQLVTKAEDRIVIMPGSGINELNISRVAKATGAKEFHLSARKVIDSEMVFRKYTLAMGNGKEVSDYSRKVADPELIKRIIKILSDL
jgi:copper homeostasis protein